MRVFQLTPYWCREWKARRGVVLLAGGEHLENMEHFHFLYYIEECESGHEDGCAALTAQWENLPRDPVLSQWSALDLLPDTFNTSRWCTCSGLKRPIMLLGFFFFLIKAISYMLWDWGQLVKLHKRLASSLPVLLSCKHNPMLVWEQLTNDLLSTTSGNKNLVRCWVMMKSAGTFCCWWEFDTNSSLFRPHHGSTTAEGVGLDVFAAHVQKELMVNMPCKVKDEIFADCKVLFYYACGQVGSAAPPADHPEVSPLTLSVDPQPDCGAADKRRHMWYPCDWTLQSLETIKRTRWKESLVFEAFVLF